MKNFDEQEFLADFHQGNREVMAEIFREYFDLVQHVVRSMTPKLRNVDRETVVSEFFTRLIERPELRSDFQGGSFRGWLLACARNYTIDYGRKYGREILDSDLAAPETKVHDRLEKKIEARFLIERFRKILPKQWEGVFEKRFIAQLPQRQAAEALGIARTTLTYQEMRIRSLLKQFFLENESQDESKSMSHDCYRQRSFLRS